MTLRYVLSFAALCALVLPLVGCGGDGGGTATVVGQALDDGTLEPVAGLTARIGNRTSGATTANGIFTLTGVPVGDQVLTITGPDYQRYDRSVQLVRGGNDLGPCYVPPTFPATRGAITGIITLGGGTPVGGAQIVTGTSRAVSRDGSGRFTLYDLPVGHSQVNFHDPKTGAGTWRYVPITAGLQPKDIGTVILSYGPPPPPL